MVIAWIAYDRSFRCNLYNLQLYFTVFTTLNSTNVTMSNKSDWLFVDTRRINKSKLSSLYPSPKDATKLYQSCTTSFSIETTDTNTYNIISQTPISPNKRKHLSFAQEVFATLSIVTFWLLYLVPVMLLILFLYFLFTGNYGFCAAFIISYILCISKTHPIWPDLLHNIFAYSFWDYFSFTYCCNADTMHYIKHQHMKGNRRNLIILSVPHGVIPMSPRLALALTQPIYNTQFIPTQADIMYYLPGMRTLSMWIGICSVSKASIIEWLNKHRIVEIIADGIAGIYAQNREENIEYIAMKDHKGIAKLALQMESDVVIGFGFGDTRMFDVLYDNMGLMEWMSRRLRAAFIVFYGRFYIPFFLPYRQPLYYVLGPIIKNENVRISNPNQTQIDAYHAKLLNAIKDLFDQHKGIYGWGDKKMIFI
eukprot:491460_1